MVDETIRSIKEAEQQAEEILVKAQEQKEQILKDASLQAKQIHEELIEEVSAREKKGAAVQLVLSELI